MQNVLFELKESLYKVASVPQLLVKKTLFQVPGDLIIKKMFQDTYHFSKQQHLVKKCDFFESFVYFLFRFSSV